MQDSGWTAPTDVSSVVGRLHTIETFVMLVRDGAIVLHVPLVAQTERLAWDNLS
jgi:hypothetical protein